MMDRKTCPKHVKFYSKNKFEKLVHVVGFIKNKSLSIHHINTFQFSRNMYLEYKHLKSNFSAVYSFH